MPINFENDLKLLQERYINKVNIRTGEIILAIYPDYTQRNILASGDIILINNTWNWINSKREIANIAKDTINNASTSKIIYDTFKNFELQIQQ
jgi:hypothetical protein